MEPDPSQFNQLIGALLAQRLSRRELLRRGVALGLGLPASALTACGTVPAATRPAAAPSPSLPPSAVPAAAPTTYTLFTPVIQKPPPLRFAVIGDYGMAGDAEAAVAGLVTGWFPDLIISVGDNNYPSGSASTIDANIGQYYQKYIAPYRGTYGAGAARNAFFPVLGNHDWASGYPQPYLNYFSLPGNGRYYRIDRGPVSFFMLDSMPGEPDGTTSDSIQGQWLQTQLQASGAPWKVVVLHHPPFSSGYHGSASWMQWPFAAWGAQLVLAGHEHSYERIARDGITYVVNGLGGAPRYAPGLIPVEGSQILFNADHGALLIDVSNDHLHMQFITRAGQVIDDLTLTQ